MATHTGKRRSWEDPLYYKIEDCIEDGHALTFNHPFLQFSHSQNCLRVTTSFVTGRLEVRPAVLISIYHSGSRQFELREPRV